MEPRLINLDDVMSSGSSLCVTQWEGSVACVSCMRGLACMCVGYIQLAAAAAMIHGSRLRSCCPRTNACMTTTAASTAAARRAFRSLTVRLASTDESVAPNVRFMSLHKARKLLSLPVAPAPLYPRWHRWVGARVLYCVVGEIETATRE